MKYACEMALERSRLPVTVLRATQFHSLIARIVRTATIGRLALVDRGMSFQPCDHRWIAGELADLALGSAPGAYSRLADHAGPERVSLAEPWPCLAVERPSRPLG